MDVRSPVYDDPPAPRPPRFAIYCSIRSLPVVLNLRGQEAIHATAILVNGTGVAFLGPTGSGKSTLAASFMLAGYRALGDDCMALLDSDSSG